MLNYADDEEDTAISNLWGVFESINRVRGKSKRKKTTKKIIYTTFNANYSEFKVFLL